MSCLPKASCAMASVTEAYASLGLRKPGMAPLGRGACWRTVLAAALTQQVTVSAGARDMQV